MKQPQKQPLPTGSGQRLNGGSADQASTAEHSQEPTEPQGRALIPYEAARSWDGADPAPDLPAEIDDWQDAKLPVAYQKAVAALAHCDKVDDAVSWANKSALLASYAKQVNDETLLDYARRIRARAYRRIGELLQALPHLRGRPKKNSALKGAIKSKAEAAADAGLTKKQERTAAEVASIEPALFETTVEQSPAPTIPDLITDKFIKRARDKVLKRMIGEDPDDVNIKRALKAVMELFDVAMLFRGNHKPIVNAILEQASSKRSALQDGVEYAVKIRDAIARKQKRGGSK